MSDCNYLTMLFFYSPAGEAVKAPHNYD